MKKIPSHFARNYDTDRNFRNEVVPGTEWVLAGEGVATRKFDGSCCMIRDGKLIKWYRLQRGNNVPEHFGPATEIDPKTGKQEGWLPVGNGPEDRLFREAFANQPDGTYELCGQKVQGNPERLEQHVLIPLGQEILPDCPRDFEGIKLYLAEHDVEGIAWLHADGRKAKIKARDFGIPRPTS